MVQDNSTDNIEELLKIAESGSEKVRFANTEVEKFIHECGITDGDTKVPTYTIYYHYYLWKNKKKTMSRRRFFLQFKKHFERIQTSDGKGYLLNSEPFDLSVEGFFKARALLRRERHVKEKAKKKQK